MRKALLSCFLLMCSLMNAQEQFTVYFDFDEEAANVSSGSKLAEWAVQHKQADIVKVYGYADSVGEAGYNIALSQRRADFVVKLLKAKGYKISAEAEVKGFGETKTFSDNAASDRIVVIHYNAVAIKRQMAATQLQEAAPENRKPEVSGLTVAVNAASKGDRLRLPNMNFYNNLDVMLPEAKPVLDELLDIMKASPNLKLTVEGHICCNKLENNKLSIRRAKVVYNYLLAGGIAKNRISYRGYAGTRPIYFLPEKTDEEREANRRVEIEITAK